MRLVGSVVALRFAENLDIIVLFVEVCRGRDVPSVRTAQPWPTNLGGASGIGAFSPGPAVYGALLLSSGWALGGSSVNVMLMLTGIAATVAGVELLREGPCSPAHVAEVVLSLRGTLTWKVLVQLGIGVRHQSRTVGIGVRQMCRVSDRMRLRVGSQRTADRQ